MPVPPPHESRRLGALWKLGILDTPPEADYDDLAALAAAVCDSPVAAVNFVDGDRHFTKAIAGSPEDVGGSVPNDLSFCAATIRTADGVLVVPDTGADESFREHPLVTGGPRVGFYAGVSITSRGERVGVLCAFGSEPRQVTDAQRTSLATLARQAEGHLELRRRNTELRDLALSDPLTGLANRTLLVDRLELALADRERSGDHVGVLFCDIDDFKAVNDRFGHDVGDRVLCDVARHLERTVRAGDTVARIAGDEFVVVCRDLAGDGLDGLVARAGDGGAGPLPDGSAGPRLSIGAVIAEANDTAGSLLRRADRAMYADKRQGAAAAR